MTDARSVYVLVESDDSVRYVGITTNTRRRFLTHRSLMCSATAGWVAGCADVRMITVHVAGDDDSAYTLEMLLIRTFRALGVHLLNRTDGGPGRGSGYGHSCEERQRIGERRRGVVTTLDTRQLIRQALTGKTRSESHLEANRVANQVEARRRKISETKRGYKLTDTEWQDISERRARKKKKRE